MSERVCAVCGADLYRKWTWTEWMPATRQAKYICMACGRNGWDFLEDGRMYNSSDRPTRYAVEWLDDQGNLAGNVDVATLRQAKRLADQKLGQVWERPNIRPRVTEDGITLWDWGDERVVYCAGEGG